MSGDSLLTFPCDLPVKVLGRNAAAFRAATARIVRGHCVERDQPRMAEQLSRHGRFVSLTFTIHAHSRSQLDALYEDLTASEDVLMVL